MITRKAFAVTLGLVVLFGVSAWGGYAYRSRRSAEAVTQQAGWCCMPDQRQCVIQSSLETCRSAGGSVYNWDKTACQNACVPPIRRGTRPGLQQQSPTP